MSSLPKEWSFLPDAWKFALVLTGCESAATALVTATVRTISRRSDLHESARMRRVFFSHLSREGAKAARIETPATPAERKAFCFHQLPEPGRQALALFSLGLFPGEQLAGLLGKSESALAKTLGEARARLQANLPSHP